MSLSSFIFAAQHAGLLVCLLSLTAFIRALFQAGADGGRSMHSLLSPLHIALSPIFRQGRLSPYDGIDDEAFFHNGAVHSTKSLS